MKRILNTFKYGSWRIRLFFGTIGLLFLGGIAAISIAAVAGLGIIPIAAGGAALVLGIGMSTMVTVVSDDPKDKPEGNGQASGNEVNGAADDASETGGNKHTGSDEAQSVNNGPQKSENSVAPADTEMPAITITPENTEVRNGKENSGSAKAARESNIIYADDDGRYIPDEIKEKSVAKASYTEKTEGSAKAEGTQKPEGSVKNDIPEQNDLSVKKQTKNEKSGIEMKKVKQPRYSSPSEGAFIDGLPPEKPENAEIKAEKRAEDTLQAAGPEDVTGQTVIKTQKAGRKNDEKLQQDEITEPETGSSENRRKKSIFDRFRSLFANMVASRKHIREGKDSRNKRRTIKKDTKKKTDEYGRELEEKFENNLSYTEKEKQREDEYAQNIRNKRAEGVKEQRPDDTDVYVKNKTDKSGYDKTEYGADPDRLPTGYQEEAEEPEANGLFGRLGKLFTKLFANVHDEPNDTGEEKDTKDNDPKAKNEKEPVLEKKKEKTKKEKAKSKKEKKKNNNEEEKRTESKDKQSGNEENEDEEDIPPQPARERLPGEELDVSKYTASNMKKIIKAKKIGKDFIPVFIESWNSQHIEKTPALCYVKDDKVHFLLLEGDMERDVSVPTNKFINVWYKKNAPVTNLKAYTNIKENMGAFEMFEDVVPNFSSSTDQMGGTSYSQNLYLLGQDIALAPPSMRELRKRFRFNTNIFDSLNTRGDYSDYFKKAYETRILWTDNVIGLQDYQRRIRAILQEMVNDTNLLKFEFEDEVAKMVQYRLITDEYADFYINMKNKQ